MLVFFPFLGLLVYYLLGQEYRKNKTFNRKNILNQINTKKTHEDLELDRREIKQVDDIFCTVETSNTDYRSFNINLEINAFMYDKEIPKFLSNTSWMT